MLTMCALATGWVLDLLFGDPHGLPWPHPVVLMGRLIALLERGLRRVLPKTNRSELVGGGALALAVPLICFAIPFFALHFLRRWQPLAAYALESLWCYQTLAARTLGKESMLVHAALVQGNLPGARRAVARIVGRDTQALDEAGVARAAVESVAENTGDGVIAPMIYLALGGAPLGMCYKAINTMDSMLGYKNERYLYFGRAAARLDDAANYLPSRVAALLLIAAAPLCRKSASAAARIWRRDRRNHDSPNSAQTEAACAGALGLQLGGGAYYAGRFVEKPAIGDPSRPAIAADIAAAGRLMYAASALCLALCLLARMLVCLP